MSTSLPPDFLISSPDSLSVVIPSYNSSSLLKNCLQALELQTASTSSFEVVVVNDGSTDDTAKMLEEFHQQTHLQLRVLHQHRSGPGRARNAGVALARFNWIGLLDADVQADSNWVASALTWIHDQPGAGAIEGQTIVGNREQITPLTHQTENRQGGRYPTCNLLVRKQFCHFHSGYQIPFREDTDLAFSILEGGFSIPFAQDLIVYHPPLAPKASRPTQLAKRYFFDGLLSRRFPWRATQQLDIHQVCGLRVPNLKKWGYSLIALVQMLILTSLVFLPTTQLPALLLLSIYASGTLLSYRLLLQSWNLKHWGLSQLFAYSQRIHLLPWSMIKALLKGYWHFRGTQRFSRAQWWEEVRLGPPSQRPRDLIVLTDHEWNHSSSFYEQQLAQHLARTGHRVLFATVNSEISQTRFSWQEKINQWISPIRQTETNLYVWSTNKIPLLSKTPIHHKLLGWLLRHRFQQLGWENPLVWSFLTDGSQITQTAGLSDLIYHHLETEDTEQKTDKKALPEICSEAQMILTNTKQSQQFCQRWNPNTRFLQSFDELGILRYSNTIQETIFRSSEKQPISHLALSGT
ncbi:MAG: glycosyltransferase [bacterium]